MALAKQKMIAAWRGQAEATQGGLAKKSKWIPKEVNAGCSGLPKKSKRVAAGCSMAAAGAYRKYRIYTIYGVIS